MKVRIALLVPNLIRDIKKKITANDIYDWEGYEKILDNLSDIKKQDIQNSMFDMNYALTKKIYISLN